MGRDELQVNKLFDRSSIGLDMLHFDDKDAYDFLESLPLHRDDNYLFIFMEKGTGSMTMDFESIPLEERQLFFLFPGQVHGDIRCRHSKGWSISITSPLINDSFKQIFELQLFQQRPIQISPELFERSRKLLELLHENFLSENSGDFHLQMIHSLLNSLLTVYARVFNDNINPNDQAYRSFQIARDFKNALSRDVKEEKNPSAYAEKLNISQVYLNKAVKSATGFTVSYWINHEVMILAKRLLWYTSLDVKEIAYSLGYQDHTYFFRLFKKTNAITPITFRKQYVKQCGIRYSTGDLPDNLSSRDLAK
jgi:AraC family transcriptional activator of pobA